ncbi:HNH endonuclease [Piscirickettsia salmonis]|uniref:HNH endonuclease n=1 Tax=Piscirickettsia salmonis TaxID=1238 RepID=UPI00053BDDC0|nr:HNH endonuclease [Piscirickettsia salmonis]
MPRRAKQICCYAGCHNTTYARYCEYHEQHGNRYHAPRKTTAQRGYGGRWQRERKIFLQDHPLCKQCLQDDKLIPATEVDHIKPHDGDHDLMWNQSNWQALCKSCHSRKTVNEDGGFGRKKSPQGRGV